MKGKLCNICSKFLEISNRCLPSQLHQKMDLVTRFFSGFISTVFDGIWSPMAAMEPWKLVFFGSVFSLLSHVLLLRILSGAEWDAQMRIKEGPHRHRGFVASLILRFLLMCLYVSQLLFLLPALCMHVARCLSLIGPADASSLVGPWTANWVVRNMCLAWVDSVLHPHLAVLSGGCIVPDTVLKAFLLPVLHGIFSYSLQSNTAFSWPPLCLAAVFCLRNTAEHLRWLEHVTTGHMGTPWQVGLVSAALLVHVVWAYAQGYIGGAQGLACVVYGAVYGMNNVVPVHEPTIHNMQRIRQWHWCVPGFKESPFNAANVRYEFPSPCGTIAEDPSWTAEREEETDSSSDEEDVELNEIAGLALDAVRPLTDLLGQGYDAWCAQFSQSQPPAVDPRTNRSTVSRSRSRSQTPSFAGAGAGSRGQSPDIPKPSTYLRGGGMSRSRSRAGTPSSRSATPARDVDCVLASNTQRRIPTFSQVTAFVFSPFTASGNTIYRVVFLAGAGVRELAVSSGLYVWSWLRYGSGVHVGLSRATPAVSGRPRRLQRGVEGEWGRPGDRLVQVDCHVCWGAKAVWTVLDCGHLCLCTQCAIHLSRMGHTACPLCRQEANRIVFTHY